MFSIVLTQTILLRNVLGVTVVLGHGMVCTVDDIAKVSPGGSRVYNFTVSTRFIAEMVTMLDATPSAQQSEPT